MACPQRHRHGLEADDGLWQRRCAGFYSLEQSRPGAHCSSTEETHSAKVQAGVHDLNDPEAKLSSRRECRIAGLA